MVTQSNNDNSNGSQLQTKIQNDLSGSNSLNNQTSQAQSLAQAIVSTSQEPKRLNVVEEAFKSRPKPQSLVPTAIGTTAVAPTTDQILMEILRHVRLQSPGSFITSKVTISSITTPTRLLSFSSETTTILIVANPNNSGQIYVGDSGVSSDIGFRLDNGDGVAIDVDNSIKPIYILGNTLDDDLTFIALTPRK